uniref:MULE transposase domain-containing protein n=1 Tax=Lactuca sativa TaxID=4236 RepID=A0A9R1VNC0_LACSA|nr:hypothetical protein LSAT_V11C500287490 [Lactuca sativa]
MTSWKEWMGDTYYERDDIHPIKTNEVDENNSFNESNYLFDDTSPFETDIHPMDTNEVDENESLNESRYFCDDTSPFKIDKVFNSRQELMDWMQNMANTLGYVIVIKNSKRNFNVVFQCDCGVENSWKIKMICEFHNHESSLYLEAHPYPRRLTEYECQIVEDLLKKNVKPNDILSALKNPNPKNTKNFDVGREREGKTQMQVVMGFLDQNGYVYYSRANVLTNKLEDLFFARPRSLEIWRGFLYVLLMDATYKTNKYGMPLLEIVDVTPKNMTFSIAFALDCLKSVMEGCMLSLVIVTNREMALMKAYAIIFPDAKGLLCTWHTNNNIMKKCKSCWDVLYTSWMRLVNSKTKEAYNKNLAQVEKITNNYPDAFSYLNKTWLTPHKEKFVSAWTDKFLNFGNHTINRAESQLAKLKRYVETSPSDIAKSLKRIVDIVESRYTDNLVRNT